MKLLGITYKGSEIDDDATFYNLPKDLQVFLKEVNGLIAYKGGLHIRGCCSNPVWHSINEVWAGKAALWKIYPTVLDIDVPFAQDCMGDQFLLRNNKVVKLYAESGETDELRIDLWQFFEEIEKDAITLLGLHPLIQFGMEGNELEPGNLLSAFPPFCLNTGQEEVISAMPVTERLAQLKDIYRQLNSHNDDDDQVRFIVG